ncbi:hypothetical protein SS1G_09072 [Sclerotinia sclerotiorum 1980 UF-70]|uniref:RING-type domain-containing protein n=2 Tax=Sclerotinia sclerotiorum (strain ATCC 18683 / 1980 / Ss-1) TaxID=665079 RepID=A7EUR4_SCLS1|nr:hypothetical protein SS1G_09072 [Sclerotinia sclerotiorum 1980 UF-70]APA15405.1 hypothetical protein sscle_14g101750 [Sclerotinia sclerotiorum 1980 UF-70]EDN93206.1 hypothetical protein SS1G_09072 [Sclerotinia sclerotiorum 1980 UF-70]
MASNTTNWLTTSSWPIRRRSTDDPFHDSHGDPFDDRYATPLQNIESGSTRRMSTQTQQRDESRQSSVSSKESRILEDIRNGNYVQYQHLNIEEFYPAHAYDHSSQICSICFEAVRFTPDHYLWHCKDCYVITHYKCALSWANANRTERSSAWKCPQCRGVKSSKPDGKCWCGNGNPIYDHSTIPNACIYGICGNNSRCFHGNKSTCQKSCHPGPFKVLNFFTEVLNGTPEQIGVRYKPVRTVVGEALITCTFLGIYILPIVAVVGGPDIYWYYQMKDSCEGFDTRVKMGTHFAESKYDLHSLNASIEDQTFYLAPVIAPEIDSNATYQYFHRFSGDTANMAHFTVDVDVDNGVWRWGTFDGPDERTKWWAANRKDDEKVLPIFENITLTEYWNGIIEEGNGHLWLPDYDIVIQGIELARKHRQIEPFIRVFDTVHTSEAYLEKLLAEEWNWSPEYNRNIVMRTASFGHGRQRLDMCIKEDFYLTEEGLEQEFDGVSNPSIVPLAIVAAYRMRMSEKYMLDSGIKERHNEKRSLED